MSILKVTSFNIKYIQQFGVARNDKSQYVHFKGE